MDGKLLSETFVELSTTTAARHAEPVLDRALTTRTAPDSVGHARTCAPA
ncbi:MAG TPA: hypothetical protein VMR00_07500 [Streptosporangiaceae bacterium]|jgi:hypothetical protein|nr:hypothetical protein [Streptosporangiaceae bacterium]